MALDGDWYVLVHYRDTGGGNAEGEPADQLFWDDEVWRFELRGEALVWTLHPHVSLRDDTGRTEELASGDAARTLGAWAPNDAQLAEIESGLELDRHAARSKTLRGTPASGHRSRVASRPGSASMIEYREDWSITGPPGRPEFERRDTMASPRAEAALGRTRYATREVLRDGAELRGEFVRDGRLVGTFRMIRIRLPDGSRR